MHACTILARNYLAHARVLARSFREQYPGGTFHALVLDPGPGLAPDEPFEVITPDDLFTPEEWGPLWFAYSALELATAVKPRLLRHLLDRFGESVTYCDADIRFFRPVAELEEAAARHAVVLTAHNTAPVPRDRRSPDELFILRSGVHNLGFVTVSPAARPFLDWWWQRLERQCLVAPERGLFVDQRWMDAAPALFDCHLLRDPTVNVAYWNLGPRQLTDGPGGYLVNGEPLTFFHFSGYDPRRPWVLSRHAGLSPRSLLSESPALRLLCDQYRAELLAAGYREVSGFGLDQDTLPGGVRLDERARRVYRGAVTPSEPDPRPQEVPNPRTDPEGLVAWLRAPGDPSHPAWLSRYLWQLYGDRRNLREAFPAVPGADEGRFLAWAGRQGGRGARIPEALLPAALPGPDPVRAAPPVGAGVNLVGYLQAEIGLGEHSRQLAAALQALGVPLSTLSESIGHVREDHAFEDLRPVPQVPNPFDVNLLSLNGNALRRFADRMGPGFFSGRYTVAYWAWELAEFPERWGPALDVVDEVWMNSEHAAIGVRRATGKPVEVLPVPVQAPVAAEVERGVLGLPDAFVFLFVFDYGSIVERKNPDGLVQAFRQAFRPGEGPVLVIKSINEPGHLVARERVRYAAGDRPDVVFLEGYLPAGHKNALMAACDCYVSLHRAEGFGITMAEAMALGKPTIATGYSGNLEFMTPGNSYLVGWREGTVPAGCRPYREGAVWAEPDLDEAAALMRRVWERPEEARRVGEAARADLARRHGPEARARLMGQLLDRIRRERLPAGARRQSR